MDKKPELPNMKNFPNQADFVEQKFKVASDIIETFPFLKGHFRVQAEYRYDGFGNQTIAGWMVILESPKKKDKNGNPATMDFIFNQALEAIYLEKIKPLELEIKDLKSKPEKNEKEKAN